MNEKTIVLKHCTCGHKPVIKKEYRSYGIITGTKFNFFVRCNHCKKKTKKYYHWKEEKAVEKAVNEWNRKQEVKQ